MIVTTLTLSKNVIIFLVLVALGGCSTTKWKSVYLYPPLDGPSPCTIEWVFDGAREGVVPKCVVDDLVEYKKGSEFIERAENLKEIKKDTINGKLLAAVSLISGAILALWTWTSSIFGALFGWL